eukprot:XP_016664315.1 PREDICTED: thymidylate kinase isoform X2 [Acyrthosiphon pisum]
MTKSAMRGALIVLEGCDRSGKTTQYRSTPIGSLINDYLSRKIELPDRSVHLLFSANRWELEPEIRKQIESGVTLIVDRYSYSGVVFTSAKQCVDFKWCCGPENGLPKPDIVMFLKLSIGEMAKRSGFGDERYENIEFQNKVDINYDKFKNDNFIQVDAAQDVSILTNTLLEQVLKTIDTVKNQELDDLVLQ